MDNLSLLPGYGEVLFERVRQRRGTVGALKDVARAITDAEERRAQQAVVSSLPDSALKYSHSDAEFELLIDREKL